MEFGSAAQLRVDARGIRNVIAVRAPALRSKQWRRIQVAHAQCVEVRRQLSSVLKGEGALQLQAVGG